MTAAGEEGGTSDGKGGETNGARARGPSGELGRRSDIAIEDGPSRTIFERSSRIFHSAQQIISVAISESSRVEKERHEKGGELDLWPRRKMIPVLSSRAIAHNKAK